jgi:hypothetical protein
MNLKKMTWLLMIVFAVLVAPVTKIQTASTVATSSASHDGCGPGAQPIPW